MAVNKNAPPQRGGRTGASGVQGLTKWTADHKYLPPLSSFVPHSRNYGGQAGRDIVWKCSQGLKPLAESRHPFGISPRVTAGQQTVSTRPQNRLHIGAMEYGVFSNHQSLLTNHSPLLALI